MSTAESTAPIDAGPKVAQEQPQVSTGNPTPNQGQPQGQMVEASSMLDLAKRINRGMAANMTAGDIRISRLGLLQPGSPEIGGQLPGYHAGMIVDNVTREVLTTFGKPPWLIEAGVPENTLQDVDYCVVSVNMKLPSEYIKWIPLTERKENAEGIVDRWEFKTLDINDPRVRAGIWRSKGGKFKGKKPPVTDNNNFLILVHDPAMKGSKGYFRVATFSRTSAPCGQAVAGFLQAQAMQNAFPFDNCFYLWTKRHPKELPGGQKTFYYTYEMARGPKPIKLEDIATESLRTQHMQMAMSLTEPGSGEVLQTTIINSVALDEDDDHEDDDFDGEVSTGNSVGELDPFTTPSEPKPVF